MSLKFSLAEIFNPLNPNAPRKVHARSQVREVITLLRLAKEIALYTSMAEGDVLNVLHSLIYKATEHMADGDAISLGDFGTFRYQISSDGADSMEEFHISKIRKVRIRFTPGKLLRPSMDQLEFERVLSIKDRKEALKLNK